MSIANYLRRYHSFRFEKWICNWCRRTEGYTERASEFFQKTLLLPCVCNEHQDTLWLLVETKPAPRQRCGSMHRNYPLFPCMVDWHHGPGISHASTIVMRDVDVFLVGKGPTTVTERSYLSWGKRLSPEWHSVPIDIRDEDWP